MRSSRILGSDERTATYARKHDTQVRGDWISQSLASVSQCIDAALPVAPPVQHVVCQQVLQWDILPDLILVMTFAAIGGSADDS